LRRFGVLLKGETRPASPATHRRKAVRFAKLFG
jgi:hypothetical protein